MNQGIFSEPEYSNQQEPFVAQHNFNWTYGPTYAEYSLLEADIWPASTLPHQQIPQQQRSSTSSQSSFASDPRTSLNTNISSQWIPSSSAASTRSSWSNVSAQGSRHTSLGSAADFQLSMFQPESTAREVLSPTGPLVSTKKIPHCHASPEKDKGFFATCVSLKHRERRSQRAPRYWCTSCGKSFVEKYDWKRHEETYQERPFVFSCSLCSRSYFLEKDFVHHHKARHNCETCQRDEHHEAAKQELQARTGWGCGFCMHFSSDWKERCNHIARHFEKDGRTMNDWHHSNVIHSLLQRPAIRVEWDKILQSQPQLMMNFGWNQSNTGRKEGFPGNQSEPHLQDRLEYYKPNDSAFDLASLAFRKIAFPACPPRAPRKDHKDNHTTSLQSLMDSPEWERLMSTIPEDNVSPTDVCELDVSMTNDAFSDTQFAYF